MTVARRVVTWVAALCLGVSTADGQTVSCPDLEARIDEGLAMRQANRDAPALEHFRALYDRCSAPRILVQMGTAEQSLHRWAEAEQHLALALANATSDPWVRTRRAMIEQVLVEVRGHVATLDLRCEAPGAELVIGERRRRMPLPEPLRMNAGDVSFEVAAPGFAPQRRRLRLDGGQTHRETVLLDAMSATLAPSVAAGSPGAVVPPTTALAPPQQQDAPPRAGTSALRVVGFGAIGVGAVLVGIGVWQWVASAIQASDASDAVTTSPEPYGAWARYDNGINPSRSLSVAEVCTRAEGDNGHPDAAQVREYCDSNATSRALAIAFGVGGAVVAGAGVAMVLLAPSSRPAERAGVRLRPWGGPRGGGIDVGIHF